MSERVYGRMRDKNDKLLLKALQAQAYFQDLHQFPSEIKRVNNYIHQLSVPQETGRPLQKMKINLTQRVNLSVKTFFPSENIVFADLVNGIIRLQTGKLLIPIYTEFASIYEEEIFLKFVNGILIDSKIVKHEPRERVFPPPPPPPTIYIK